MRVGGVRMTDALRGISYGGGVQSTALIVLAAEGKLDALMGGPVNTAVFANTGDDSEHPETLRYVRGIITPWAAERGIEVHEAVRRYADGRPYPTLLEHITDPAMKGLAIPVRMKSGAPARRICTYEWKAAAVQKWWATERGASPEDPVTIAIGFSTDEWQRMTNRTQIGNELVVYPLIDLRLSRGDCEQLIADAGLPVPPKSSCWFCPWRRLAGWRDMKRDEPELFERSVQLERVMSDKAVSNGYGPVLLTDSGLPLDRAVGDGVQGSLFEGPESCGDSCWT